MKCGYVQNMKYTDFQMFSTQVKYLASGTLFVSLGVHVTKFVNCDFLLSLMYLKHISLTF